MKKISKIYRIVLLAQNSKRKVFERYLMQANLDGLTVDELATLATETGKSQRYSLRTNPNDVLWDYDSWRFLDHQDDTLCDMYVYFYPPKSKGTERTFVIEPRRFEIFSGGLDFAYETINEDGKLKKTPLCFWIPEPISEFEGFSKKQIEEERTYIVIHHPEDAGSEILMNGSESIPITEEQFDTEPLRPPPKAGERFKSPKILDLSEERNLFLTGGWLAWVEDKIFGKHDNNPPYLRRPGLEEFLNFIRRCHST